MDSLTLTEFHTDVMKLVAKYVIETENVIIAFEQTCKVLSDNQSSTFSSSKSKKDISSH